MAALFQRILLTSDLSEDALRAFAPVAELARALGSRVTLLHVVPDLVIAPHGAPLAAPLHAPEIGRKVGEAEGLLREQAARHLPDLEVEVHVSASGDVAREIARHAREGGFDLVALSTHGRTGFRRMVLGSVAESVLRHSEVPVLCFPRHHG